jgi:hypothetical protein
MKIRENFRCKCGIRTTREIGSNTGECAKCRKKDLEKETKEMKSKNLCNRCDNLIQHPNDEGVKTCKFGLHKDYKIVRSCGQFE